MNFKKLTLSLLALSTLAVLTDANAAAKTIVQGDSPVSATIGLTLKVAEICVIDGFDLFDGQDKTLTRTMGGTDYSLSLGNLSATCNGGSALPKMTLTSTNGGSGNFKLKPKVAGASDLAYTVKLGSTALTAGSMVELTSSPASLVFAATVPASLPMGEYNDTVTATFTLS